MKIYCSLENHIWFIKLHDLTFSQIETLLKQFCLLKIIIFLPQTFIIDRSIKVKDAVGYYKIELWSCKRGNFFYIHMLETFLFTCHLCDSKYSFLWIFKDKLYSELFCHINQGESFISSRIFHLFLRA